MQRSERTTQADPALMLAFLRGKASDRKLRLFACACCRLVWQLLPTRDGRARVESAEQRADGRTTIQTPMGAEHPRYPAGGLPGALRRGGFHLRRLRRRLRRGAGDFGDGREGGPGARRPGGPGGPAGRPLRPPLASFQPPMADGGGRGTGPGRLRAASLPGFASPGHPPGSRRLLRPLAPGALPVARSSTRGAAGLSTSSSVSHDRGGPLPRPVHAAGARTPALSARKRKTGRISLAAAARGPDNRVGPATSTGEQDVMVRAGCVRDEALSALPASGPDGSRPDEGRRATRYPSPFASQESQRGDCTSWHFLRRSSASFSSRRAVTRIPRRGNLRRPPTRRTPS